MHSKFKFAIITAIIINIQPKISLCVITSFKISVPPRTANTDSRKRINEAITGKVYFCPKICKVYATPQVKMPANNNEALALIIIDNVGFSNDHIRKNDKIPTTKN